MKNKNSQSDSLTDFIKTFVFHVKDTDCRSPPRLPASYHLRRAVNRQPGFRAGDSQSRAGKTKPKKDDKKPGQKRKTPQQQRLHTKNLRPDHVSFVGSFCLLPIAGICGPLCLSLSLSLFASPSPSTSVHEHEYVVLVTMSNSSRCQFCRRRSIYEIFTFETDQNVSFIAKYVVENCNNVLQA